jgi:hypothetical protein
MPTLKNAIKRGGRVRTKKLPGGKFIHTAYLDGKNYEGEVKSKKTNPPGTTRKK